MVRQSIIKETYWTQVEKHAAVDSLVKDDLMSLVKRFLQMCHIDFFVHGNFTPQVSSSWKHYTSGK